MLRWAWGRWLSGVAMLALAGCADSSLVLKGRVDGLQQQQLALSRQNQELLARASALDKDNQELEKLLAQARQTNKVLEDQLTVVREQLSSATSQLARLRDDKKNVEQKVQALMASMQRQGGVAIDPNNSLLRTLPAIHQPDVQVRRDGDVIRVEIPSHMLFETGTAQLRPGGVQLLSSVATELLRDYPNQMIGVEGHTDSDPVRTNLWRNNNHLALARATAVYEMLIAQTRLQAKQLLVVGHGANHPVVSNATPAGKQRNSRIELVIYPERVE